MIAQNMMAKFSHHMPENLRKRSVYEKFYHPENYAKSRHFCCEHMETIIHFRKIIMAQPLFYY